ncbi:thioredoxin family protein [Desertifilum tharense]|nr:thioredoxin family protein [Desertifilum tharense]
MLHPVVIKFSSLTCATCQQMSRFDRRLVEEMGLTMVDVKMQDTATYRQYRAILLAKYPRKVGMQWPTYLVCQFPIETYQILGEISGEQQPQTFQQQLQAILALQEV